MYEFACEIKLIFWLYMDIPTCCNFALPGRLYHTLCKNLSLKTEEMIGVNTVTDGWTIYTNNIQISGKTYYVHGTFHNGGTIKHWICWQTK